MSQFSKCVSITLLATSLACLAAPLPALADDVNDGLVVTSPADSADVMIYKSRKIPANPKVGLALGGGGARGAAHVGALRMLEKEGIKFDYIVGTSIGSVVGGLYAAGATVDEIDRAFQSGKVMSSFMTVPLTVRIAVAPVMFVPRLFGKKSYDGLYKGNKFRKFLEQGIVTCPEMQIEKLKTPYAAVALNLLDGKPYMIRKGNLGYAMQASCAVPGLRKPVEMGDKLLVDGGVVCNVPVKQCREMGADIVIAVNIDQPFTPAERQAFLKVGSVAQRMLTWDLYAMDKFQAQIADVCIHPNTDKISLISRKKSDAKKGYDAGVIAAKDAIPSIRKALEGVNMISTSKKIEAAEVVQ